MQLYQASNGNFPKSHDEFMTHIIRANNINLPRATRGPGLQIHHPDTADLWFILWAGNVSRTGYRI